MAADGSVIIKIEADDKDFSKKLKGLDSSANDAISKLTKITAGATAALGGLAVAAAKVGTGNHFAGTGKSDPAVLRLHVFSPHFSQFFRKGAFQAKQAGAFKLKITHFLSP